MTTNGQWPRLPREFFDRPSTEVGPTLLGCVLWHDSPDGRVAVRLTEVEAYLGAADAASHAYRGRTARNAVMFGEPGYAYVYFTYGMHFCVNLVCQPEGIAEAVLLRAGEVVAGAELAAARRARAGRQVRPVDLARGPGRLCQALAIGRDQDGADVCGPGGRLGIGAPGVAGDQRPAAAEICAGPRVGITRAADRPWRYWLAGDSHVSVYRPAKPRTRTPRPVTGTGPGDGTMHR
jgi:DNA-3-methyladenine glycosylase